jgi:hypothetical protein
MNTPERRRIFVWRLGGWLVSVAVSVSWARSRVEA